MQQKSIAQQVTPLAKIVSVVAVAALTLTACSGGGPSENAFEFNQNGVVAKLTYYAEGDVVTKQTLNTVVNYQDAGLGDKQSAEQLMKPVAEKYKGVKGLKHELKFGDSELTESLTVDYKEADITEVSKLPGTGFTSTPKKGEKVSLKETIKMVEEAGFKAVK